MATRPDHYAKLIRMFDDAPVNRPLNAVLTIEYQDWFNPNYHSTNDTFNTLTIPLAVDILRLNVAAMSTAAGIHRQRVQGAAAPYGPGLGGANVGSLASGAVPTIGENLVLDVSGFDGSDSVQVIVSANPVSTSMWGGTLLVNLSGRLASLFSPLTNGSSILNVPLPPSSSLVGLVGYLQAGAADPTQPQGVALSNGLAITIGE